MTIKRGQRLQTIGGARYEVVEEIAAGGQGRAVLVEHARTRERAVAKLFDPAYAAARPQLGYRLEFLLRQRLHERSVVFAGAPRERLEPAWGHELGYVCGWAPGLSWNEFAAKHAGDLVMLLGASAALARAVDLLETLGLAHGDLSGGNVRVDDASGAPRLMAIDFDNLAWVGPATPPGVGTPGYIGPELLEGRTHPGITSDRFSIAVLVCEGLLTRHPLAGRVGDFGNDAEVLHVLRTQRLIDRHDHESAGGAPTVTLSAELRAMLRAGLSFDPRVRPHAAELARVLRAAVDRVWRCGRCSFESVDDGSRTGCPYCGADDALSLLLDGGRVIRLADPVVRIGRSVLGNSPSTSHDHARAVRNGFSTRLIDVGSTNGTWLALGRNWTRLPPGEAIELRPGDRLRFGTLQAEVLE